jgi:hypothetical protein
LPLQCAPSFFPPRQGWGQNGLVAQSVEQRIENPCVGGSIPPRATNIKRLAAMQAFFIELVQSFWMFFINCCTCGKKGDRVDFRLVIA